MGAVKVTVAPGTVFPPISVTVATRGFVNAVPMAALWPLPLVNAMFAGAPGVFVRLKVADALPAVAQAAIAHAQFETIHPFADGNGRTGRVLIHVILRRRGLAGRVVPPVSLVLATWAGDYVEGLTRTRYVGSSLDGAAVAGLDAWIALFAGACRRAVADAETYERQVRELVAKLDIRGITA